jgi:beta-glucanase (GH16 family)
MKYISVTLLFLTTLFFSGCTDDDNGIPKPLNLPKISTTDLAILEGDVDQEISLVITLTGENTTNAIVDFASIATTASELDYEILTKSPIIFKSGETTKSIDIKVFGDETKELKEKFQIKLYNPKNVTIEKDLINVEISDDDDSTQGLVIPTSGYSTPISYPGFKLTWSDEFEGEKLNSAVWTYELGDGCPNNCGWGNNELQHYREDNTTLSNGNLVITAKKQNFGSKQYTSSRIVTKGKKFFKFGRIDIRAALPKGKGLWPALWMLGSNIDAAGWPSCGEIDIMELAGDLPNRSVATVHYGSSTATHQYKSNTLYLKDNKNFQNEFHVFSLNWVEDKLEFLVDDEIYHTITPTSLGNNAYPFNKNFFFIFNVAVGGTFPGNPDGTANFPQSMIVDYVRVFNKG